MSERAKALPNVWTNADMVFEGACGGGGWKLKRDSAHTCEYVPVTRPPAAPAESDKLAATEHAQRHMQDVADFLETDVNELGAEIETRRRSYLAGASRVRAELGMEVERLKRSLSSLLGYAEGRAEMEYLNMGLDEEQIQGLLEKIQIFKETRASLTPPAAGKDALAILEGMGIK